MLNLNMAIFAGNQVQQHELMEEKNNNPVLSDQEALKLILDAFRMIVDYHSIMEIKQFAKDANGKKADKNWVKKHPRITFSITKEEIQSLKRIDIIKDDFNLSEELGSVITDPLNKLLYAFIWKNGDLRKLKHLIKGIANTVDDNEQGEALEYYHLGKHLTHETGQPLIDQHVLRAFELFQLRDKKPEAIDRIRHNDKCEDIELISAYKAWWLKTVDPKIKGNMEHSYQIEKLLYEVGKRVKKGKKAG